MVTKQISRNKKEHDPQFVEETIEEYITRIGGRKPKTQKFWDLTVGGWE